MRSFLAFLFFALSTADAAAAQLERDVIDYFSRACIESGGTFADVRAFAANEKFEPAGEDRWVATAGAMRVILEVSPGSSVAKNTECQVKWIGGDQDIFNSELEKQPVRGQALGAPFMADSMAKRWFVIRPPAERELKYWRSITFLMYPIPPDLLPTGYKGPRMRGILSSERPPE